MNKTTNQPITTETQNKSHDGLTLSFLPTNVITETIGWFGFLCVCTMVIVHRAKDIQRERANQVSVIKFKCHKSFIVYTGYRECHERYIFYLSHKFYTLQIDRNSSSLVNWILLKLTMSIQMSNDWCALYCVTLHWIASNHRYGANLIKRQTESNYNYRINKQFCWRINQLLNEQHFSVYIVEPKSQTAPWHYLFALYTFDAHTHTPTTVMAKWILFFSPSFVVLYTSY